MAWFRSIKDESRALSVSLRTVFFLICSRAFYFLSPSFRIERIRKLELDKLFALLFRRNLLLAAGEEEEEEEGFPFPRGGHASSVN